jgi:hypothetical protein
MCDPVRRDVMLRFEAADRNEITSAASGLQHPFRVQRTEAIVNSTDVDVPPALGK